MDRLEGWGGEYKNMDSYCIRTVGTEVELRECNQMESEEMLKKYKVLKDIGIDVELVKKQ